jgi:hypothetical protein
MLRIFPDKPSTAAWQFLCEQMVTALRLLPMMRQNLHCRNKKTVFAPVTSGQ